MGAGNGVDDLPVVVDLEFVGPDGGGGIGRVVGCELLVKVIEGHIVL